MAGRGAAARGGMSGPVVGTVNGLLPAGRGPGEGRAGRAAGTDGSAAAAGAAGGAAEAAGAMRCGSCGAGAALAGALGAGAGVTGVTVGAAGLGAAPVPLPAAVGRGPGVLVAGLAGVAPPVGAAAPACGYFSRSLRTTGASTVEDADLTNSPMSLSCAKSVLLSVPNSRASSCTRAFPATVLPHPARGSAA